MSKLPTAGWPLGGKVRAVEKTTRDDDVAATVAGYLLRERLYRGVTGTEFGVPWCHKFY